MYVTSLPKYTGLCSPTSGKASECSSGAYQRSHSPSSSSECVFDGSYSGACRRNRIPSSSPSCLSSQQSAVSSQQSAVSSQQSLETASSHINTGIAIDTAFAEEKKGIAACVLVLDDTIRLLEWVAYHYTVLPLSSLIIGFDPKSSNDSIAEYHAMSENWKDAVGLPIKIWPVNELPKMNISSRKMANQAMQQRDFVNSCVHHFIDEGKENWVILTDTDEFLTYNFIKPGENHSYFDPHFQGPTAPTIGKRLAQRESAMPIRQRLPSYKNKTILSLIEDEQRDPSQDEFPRKNGCTRVVGLGFSTDVTDESKDELLMTLKFRHHQKHLGSDFSKVFLELSKIQKSQLTHWETIHNPYVKVCGKNGKYSSGMDYIASVLRVNHYVGSLESYMERAKDRRGSRTIAAYQKRNERYLPVEEEPDDSIDSWFDRFLLKVGEDTVADLLLKPISERVAKVKADNSTVRGR
jgi:hypothetical protein